MLLPAGFLFLLWQVLSKGPVLQLDVHVRNVIQGLATRPDLAKLARPGHALADIGDPPLDVPILVLAAIVATAVARTWRPAAVLVGAIGTLLFVAYLKIAVNRPGPGQYAGGRTSPSSAAAENASFGSGLAHAGQGWGYFPSGHTADTLICFGTAALLLNTWVLSSPRARAWTVRIAAALVALVIAGLLWSNYHWLLDTVGSLCLCGAALLVFRRFCVLSARTANASGGDE